MIKKFLEVNFIKNILLSTFLINIIFYKIPIEIYYFNRPEFHNYAIILIPTLIIFLLSLFFYKKILNNKTIFDTFLILSISLFTWVNCATIRFKIKKVCSFYEVTSSRKTPCRLFLAFWSN